jgi:hypothetical protein
LAKLRLDKGIGKSFRHRVGALSRKKLVFHSGGELLICPGRGVLMHWLICNVLMGHCGLDLALQGVDAISQLLDVPFHVQVSLTAHKNVLP